MTVLASLGAEWMLDLCGVKEKGTFYFSSYPREK